MAPKIIVSPLMGVTGSPGMHEIRTDLLLLTKVAGRALGPGPQAVDRALNGLISRKMEEMRFTGELEQFLLVEIDPRRHPVHPQRYVLLAGIGSPQKFSGKVACKIFQLLVDKALETGVEHVTIPFVPNRMTVTTLNLKGTAHLLKEVVEDKLESRKRMKLAEIQILCSPQAKKHIDEGLRIPPRHRRSCCIDVP